MFTQNYADALKVITQNPHSLKLMLVGCGGTGSWLAPAIARVGRWLIETGHDVDIIFIDPDQVEEKNIYRQNFCKAEIGINKAYALARRYSQAWGLTIVSLDKKFDGERPSGFHGPAVVCGCVDGPEGRHAILKFLGDTANVWWIDSGNTASFGQVLIGCNRDRWDKENPLSIPGFTSWLPTPATQHPELVTMDAASLESPSIPLHEEGQEAELSCAEMVMRDSQGMAINQRMAAEMADYLIRLLITKDLRKYATYIDLETGSCQSKYITAEFITESLKNG